MMIRIGVTALALSAAASQQAPNAGSASHSEQAVVQRVDASGRCATLSQTPRQQLTERPAIAPGAPPLLSFRLYEDARHHRFGNVDVMLDDAGH